MKQDEEFNSVWYRALELQPDGRTFIAEKILLVIDKDHFCKHKFNLTRLNLEQINTYEELLKMFPLNYDYEQES